LWQAWYHMACACALLGDSSGAVANLRKAIELHPEYRQRASSDTDFDPVRSNPDFKALVGRGN
jgi:hypothetical protein